jgi:hypothetical protein
LAGGPIKNWPCGAAYYGAAVVASGGTVHRTESGPTATFSPNDNSKLIGADEILKAAQDGFKLVVIDTGTQPSLLIGSDAAIDLRKGGTSLQIKSGAAVVVAGAVFVGPDQNVWIQATALDQITCPQTNGGVNGVCPDSRGMGAVLYGGTLKLDGVALGVGESSCGNGQVITKDVTTLDLSLKDSSSQRICINANIDPLLNMNLSVKGNIGPNRRIFLRLHEATAAIAGVTMDPTANFLVGQGTGLCY